MSTFGPVAPAPALPPLELPALPPLELPALPPLEEPPLAPEPPLAELPPLPPVPPLAFPPPSSESDPHATRNKAAHPSIADRIMRSRITDPDDVRTSPGREGAKSPVSVVSSPDLVAHES